MINVSTISAVHSFSIIVLKRIVEQLVLGIKLVLSLKLISGPLTTQKTCADQLACAEN